MNSCHRCSRRVLGTLLISNRIYTKTNAHLRCRGTTQKRQKRVLFQNIDEYNSSIKQRVRGNAVHIYVKSNNWSLRSFWQNAHTSTIYIVYWLRAATSCSPYSVLGRVLVFGGTCTQNMPLGLRLEQKQQHKTKMREKNHVVNIVALHRSICVRDRRSRAFLL